MKFWIALLGLGLLGCFLQQTVPFHTGAGTGNGFGPPNYLGSRTDTTVCQPNTTVPSLGTGLLGAGTIISGDNCFADQMERVTDNNTDPSRPGHTYHADNSGSSEVNLFNADSTCFYAGESGGLAVPFKLNPSTMALTRFYASNYPSTGGLIFNATSGYPYNGGWMGHGAGCTFYGFNRPAGRMESVDLTSATPPTPVVVKDFTTADCMTAIPASATIGGLDVADNRMMVYGGSGGQNNWQYVSVYDKSHGGCSTLNMTTGTITGAWGSTGTVGISDRFGLHNARMSLDGNWAQISRGTCLTTCTGIQGQYLWQIGTTNIVPITNSLAATGHRCNGYSTVWNETTISGGVEQYYKRAFTSINTSTPVNTAPPQGVVGDSHTSCNNENTSDTLAIFDSTSLTTALNTPVTKAWQGECIGIKNDGSGQVVRFCHVYTHSFLAKDFEAQNAIASNSQDGRFAALSTYWNGTLGSTDGISNTCTYAAGGDCRADLVLVKLN